MTANDLQMNRPLAMESVLNKLPFSNRLKSVFQFSAFLETDEGSQRYESYKTAYKVFSIAKKWTPFLYAGFIIITLITGLLFKNFGSVFFYSIVVYLVYLCVKINYRRKENKYLDKRWAYALDLAKKISPMLGGYYYLFPDAHILFYNSHLCIYVDAGYGGLIGYDKGSIKKVNLDHVHLGSTTVSKSDTTGMTFNSGSINQNTLDYRGRSTNYSTTKTTANTKVHYEWKLDILTSFIEEPHITLVFPDDKDGEDSAKKAFAVLS